MGLEEEDSAVTEVEVDEMFRFVCDVGAEISPYDAVPGWAFSLVELRGVCQRRVFVSGGGVGEWRFTVFLM